MKTRGYTLPRHRLDQLADELIAAIPALAPVPIPGDPDGTMTPSFTLSDLGERITLEVPDSVSDAALEAVMQAHVPYREPEPNFGTEGRRPTGAQVEQAVTQLRNYRALDKSTLTVAQRIAALEAVVETLCGLVLFLLRRAVGG